VELYRGVASLATRAEFQAAIRDDRPTVVDFMAAWCGKCRQLAPLVSQLAAKHPDLVRGRGGPGAWRRARAHARTQRQQAGQGWSVRQRSTGACNALRA
jgi:thiol-disulfide isomerase/thioredoxin